MATVNAADRAAERRRSGNAERLTLADRWGFPKSRSDGFDGQMQKEDGSGCANVQNRPGIALHISGRTP